MTTDLRTKGHSNGVQMQLGTFNKDKVLVGASLNDLNGDVHQCQNWRTLLKSHCHTYVTIAGRWLVGQVGAGRWLVVGVT